MSEAKYTLTEAHLHFAQMLNGQVWQLMGSKTRTVQDTALMLHAAHASLYHWLQVGNVTNHQRGLWLLSRVYATLGDGHHALRCARRCMALTEAHRADMADFDVAYAYEGMARALTLSGKKDEADGYFRRAQEAGAAIVEKEDRDIFLSDLGTELAS